MESKEAIRARVKRFRERKKAQVDEVSSEVGDASFFVHIKRLEGLIGDLDKRVSRLEVGGIDIIRPKRDPDVGIDRDDLFRRVMKAKERRLGCGGS